MSDPFVSSHAYIAPQLSVASLVLEQLVLIGSSSTPEDPEETDI